VSRVVVYTAPGCHLCRPAVEVVRSVCGSDFEVVDITTDTAVERQYRERIPVVEVDGIERFRYHVDESELRDLVV
jgi:glutaredoxin-related protein